MTAPVEHDPTVAQVAAAALGAAIITQQTANVTTNAIQALWAAVNPYNAAEVAAFAQQAGQILVTSQRTVANTHIAAQLLALRAVGINQSVVVTIPDNVRGATVDFSGRTPKVKAATETIVDYDDGKETVPHKDSRPEILFTRAAEKYRYERSIDTPDEAANSAAQQKIADLVDTNMILSARLAQQQTLKLVRDKDARLIGYRRIIHPELSKGGVCGMCVAAADRVYQVWWLRPIHARCQCTVSPVTSEHDPGLQLNQDDLDRLYEHAAETAPTENIYARRSNKIIGERKALSTSKKALRKVRYQIDQHNEYGPVLTRVTGEPLPYYTTQPTAA